MLSTLTRACRAVAVSVSSTFTRKNRKRLSRAISGHMRTNPGRSIFEPLEDRTLMSTYYVSTSGSDSNSGTSSSSPWKSIAKVNTVNLNPGDSVLFKGGDTFDGTLNVGSGDTGSSSSPVTFSSYSGQATINSGKSNGALVNNCTNVVFNDLKFTGTSAGSGTQSGITFQGYTNNYYYSGDKVENCNISGYYYAGILLEGGYTNGGLTGVVLTNNSVYNNVNSGIDSVGSAATSLENITVSYNQVYNNYGDGHSAATGNGIELGDVTNAMVEYNVAYLNGSTGGIGGVGIWAYEANDVTFQYNESYDNKTTKGNDGDGFDFDTDVRNSVMQYNYAFGNDGTGAQLDQWQNNSLFTNDIIRYNVFQDNGRKNNYGNLEVWGRVLNSYLYNNVIYTTPGTSGSNSAIRVHNSTIPGLYVDGVHFVNNIIDTSNGAALINIPEGEAQGAQNLTFTGNVYYTNGSAFKIIDGNSTISSLASWQSIGQETWDGKKYGINANPDFVSSNTAVATPEASTSSLASAAAGYKLESNSPALSESLSITSMYGVSTGGLDYYGDTIGSSAATVAGAYQSGPVATSSSGIASTTSPATTAPVTTAPVTTAPVTTAPVATAPVTTAPATNVSSLSGYDIGTIASKGSNSSSSGTFTVTSGGSDIWGTSDAFRYDETSLTGNGTIIAKVSSLSDANAWAKAGVMIRSSLAADSAEVSMLISPNDETSFEQRDATDAATSSVNSATGGDAWVKLVRNGNTFTGYISSDGVNWTQVSSTTVDMSSTVLIGLAVSPHTTSDAETAVFSNVSIV